MGSCFKGILKKKNVYTFQHPYTSAESSGTYRTSTASLQGWNSNYTISPNGGAVTTNGSAVNPDVTYRDPHADKVDHHAEDQASAAGSSEHSPEAEMPTAPASPVPQPEIEVEENHGVVLMVPPPPPPPDSQSRSSHNDDDDNDDYKAHQYDGPGVEQEVETHVIEISPSEIHVSHAPEGNTILENGFDQGHGHGDFSPNNRDSVTSHSSSLPPPPELTPENNIVVHSTPLPAEEDENLRNKLMEEIHSSTVEVNIPPEMQDVHVVTDKTTTEAVETSVIHINTPVHLDDNGLN